MKERNSKKYFPHILLFLLILLSGSVFQVVLFTPVWFFSLIVSFTALIKDRFISKRLFVNCLILFLVCLVFLLSNYIFTHSPIFYDYLILILQISLVIFALLFLLNKEIDIKNGLYSVLKFICYHSLIGFFLLLFFSGKPWVFNDVFPVNTLANIFFYKSDEVIGNLTFYRNQGLFWEPGILMIYANFLLFLSLFIYNEKRIRIIAIVTILSTFSTTGFFIMAIQVGSYIFSGDRNKKRLSFFSKSVILVVVSVFVVLGALSVGNKKELSEETAISSYSLRMFDLYSGFEILKNNPINGIGLNKVNFLVERDKVLPPEFHSVYELFSERGNSNSLIMLFVYFGFPLGVILLVLISKQNLIIQKRKLFFLIILLSLINEPLLLTPFFILFLLSGALRSMENFNSCLHNQREYQKT